MNFVNYFYENNFVNKCALLPSYMCTHSEYLYKIKYERNVYAHCTRKCFPQQLILYPTIKHA